MLDKKGKTSQSGKEKTQYDFASAKQVETNIRDRFCIIVKILPFAISIVFKSDHSAETASRTKNYRGQLDPKVLRACLFQPL